MSGRLVPFALMLLVFALLPFLGGTTPQTPRESVVLAAGSPAAVQEAVAVVGQARNELTASATAPPTLAAAPAVSAFSDAIGGGLFMFPVISLVPQTAEALAAPLVGGPRFIHPVPGGEVSPFGPRIHPLLGRPMFHTGIDLAATCGTPIHAAADGTVIYARVSASWGGRTIIQHSPTLKTAYGHQSKFLVTEGQVVKQGQVIGLVGTTGWSTGCHLHFDVIINDRYVDPAPYLGFAPSDIASVPYAAVPHLVIEPGSQVIRTVEDGDVPISDATTDTSSDTDTDTPTATPTHTPSATPTHTPSVTPTTTVPSTTTTDVPTTTVPSTTTTDVPTTTVPSTTATDVPTTTTTAPPTTTTAPPTTDPLTTTTAPSTVTTTDPSTIITTTATEVFETATTSVLASEATTSSTTSTTTSTMTSTTTAAEGGN